MNPKYLGVLAAALMLVSATAFASTGSAFAYEKSHAISQVNDCGNGEAPTNIGCQNTDSQIQGDENVASLASQQSFPGEGVVPPDEIGCPDDTVWDITVVEDEPTADVFPLGIVICLFEGLGEQDAFAIPPGDPSDIVEISVTTGLLDDNGECPGRPQLAEVTSGIPPEPLEMGSTLCVVENLEV
jgi:hypothetical protein